jgi:putative oxidoreductase
MANAINRFFEARKDYGPLFIRLVSGWRLIAGTWVYALMSKPIGEVEDFFRSLNIPAPLIFAWLAVYAQFACGILFIIGLWVRPAAIVMIINFSVALIAAHTGDPVKNSFSAWVLLAISLCLLFTGAGKISVDAISRSPGGSNSLAR